MTMKNPTLGRLSQNSTQQDAEVPDKDIIMGNNDTDILETEQELSLPKEVLDGIGVDPNVQQSPPFTLHEAISSRWSHLLIHGLEKDHTIDLFKSYATPDNCKRLESPKINPEVEVILSIAYIKRDQCHKSFQEQLSKASSALGKGINLGLLTNDNNSLLPLVDAGGLYSNLAL